MAKTDFTSVDEYIAAQPASARPVLERVRSAIRKALPGATEGISYQIPFYKLDGAIVLYFAGFKSHYSIYPATARVISALTKDLAARLHSKATLRFSFEEAVPTGLIARIAKLRAAEAKERKLEKTASKSKRAKPRARRKPAKRR